MIPNWVADYIGMPFADKGRDRMGCDCYGLVRLVLMEHAGIEIPEYGDPCTSELRAAAIRSGRAGKPWVRIAMGEERAFDIAAITDVYRDAAGAFQSAPLHVGVVVDLKWLLHTRRDTDARLERYDRQPLRAAVDGFWRWAP